MLELVRTIERLIGTKKSNILDSFGTSVLAIGLPNVFLPNRPWCARLVRPRLDASHVIAKSRVPEGGRHSFSSLHHESLVRAHPMAVSLWL